MNNDIKYVGIDIGGSHIKVALVTSNYEIINEDNVFYGNIEPNLKPSYIYEHITKYIDNLSKEIFDNIEEKSKKEDMLLLIGTNIVALIIIAGFDRQR